MSANNILDELYALRRLRDVLSGLRGEISEAAEVDVSWEAVADVLAHLDRHYPKEESTPQT